MLVVHVDDVPVTMPLGPMRVRVPVRLRPLPALMLMPVMLVMDVQVLMVQECVFVFEHFGIDGRL